MAGCSRWVFQFRNDRRGLEAIFFCLVFSILRRMQFTVREHGMEKAWPAVFVHGLNLFIESY